MEYHKIINLLDNTTKEPSKFRTRKWVEINEDSRGTYNTNSQIKFKTTMLKSSLCDYSDACILVKGTITRLDQEEDAAAIQADRNNKKVIYNAIQKIIMQCKRYNAKEKNIMQKILML